MTPEELKPIVIDVLTRIAPELDPASIDGTISFRDQLDLDSMDFLNFVLALHDRLGIEIPETDYPRLYTLDSVLTYLASKPVASPPATSASESGPRTSARP